MANRVRTIEYGNRKEILKFNDFISTVVTVSDEGVQAADGKKIVKAGTIIGGLTKPVLLNPGEFVEDKNTAEKATGAEGVLLYDVDVTNGSREGAMVIWGFIDLAKIPTEPVAEINLPQITFMK
ncbi:hypothetical protein NE686_00530 [Tissierella carlieri]|uniref:Uncharacterized protein n=1 Tax=Tissierella carlieri TaxID=689904 RepID=A0ABT1S524_9FIRM|nr:hypothetical protein [Tissierella carlieri]MCQ4921554.1 hypothetical protein [Tissierella carlieri]